MDAPAPNTTAAGARTLEAFLSAIGIDAPSEVQLALAVRHGLPLHAIEVLQAWGLTAAEIDALVIPRRTLAHRRKSGQPLSPAESDRVLRIVQMVAHAEETFGNRMKADIWLRRPTHPLDDHAPLALADTQYGADTVNKLLLRMDYGIFA